MPSLRVIKELKTEIYFATFTVVDWADVFTSDKYFEVLIDSLEYCQSHKTLHIYGYVLLTNHMHILFSASDAIAFIRDFKKFTTQACKSLLQDDHRKYLLEVLQSKEKQFQLWQSTNYPRQIESDHFFEQKLTYIHNNPVLKGYVISPEDWQYSSASWYQGKRDVPLQIEMFDF